MKKWILAISLLAASVSQAAVLFSRNSPLSAELQRALALKIEKHCHVQAFSVVESRTLLQADQSYFTTFAVLTADQKVYASIDAQSAMIGNQASVRLSSPLCPK